MCAVAEDWVRPAVPQAIWPHDVSRDQKSTKTTIMRVTAAGVRVMTQGLLVRMIQPSRRRALPYGTVASSSPARRGTRLRTTFLGETGASSPPSMTRCGCIWGRPGHCRKRTIEKNEASGSPAKLSNQKVIVNTRSRTQGTRRDPRRCRRHSQLRNEVRGAHGRDVQWEMGIAPTLKAAPIRKRAPSTSDLQVNLSRAAPTAERTSSSETPRRLKNECRYSSRLRASRLTISNPSNRVSYENTIKHLIAFVGLALLDGATRHARMSILSTVRSATTVQLTIYNSEDLTLAGDPQSAIQEGNSTRFNSVRQYAGSTRPRRAQVPLNLTSYRASDTTFPPPVPDALLECAERCRCEARVEITYLTVASPGRRGTYAAIAGTKTRS